ncbi:MAG: branched-chain amino acid ABC transporter permease [Candidatus Tectimicrobiota bacterium]
MLYRVSGQIKTTYAADMAIFPLAQDRWGLLLLLVLALGVVPFAVSNYLLTSLLIPWLIFALAATGLNLLTGYAGQLSLGHAGFMGVGAYAAYNLATRLPGLPLLGSFLGAGLITTLVGLLFGLPSLRIKGFYLSVTTLAAQFIIEWTFSSMSWFSGGSATMTLDTPPMRLFGYPIQTPLARYYLTLGIVLVMTLLAKNLVRGQVGRAWMAVRDMDVAAEVIGIPLLRTKLLAFAVSSFYAGIAGALYAFVFLTSVDITAFTHERSFVLLFMVIIGGLGSILGSFLGAAFIVLLPISLNHMAALFAGTVPTDLIANLELMVFGGLIIFFLIVEPHGLARLWQTAKDKLRLWPFPH